MEKEASEKEASGGQAAGRRLQPANGRAAQAGGLESGAPSCESRLPAGSALRTCTSTEEHKLNQTLALHIVRPFGSAERERWAPLGGKEQKGKRNTGTETAKKKTAPLGVYSCRAPGREGRVVRKRRVGARTLHAPLGHPESSLSSVMAAQRRRRGRRPRDETSESALSATRYWHGVMPGRHCWPLEAACGGGAEEDSRARDVFSARAHWTDVRVLQESPPCTRAAQASAPHHTREAGCVRDGWL
ncbi:hypothetical protein HPB50_023211 [Hyalomma asiaticum]|uniref:Uncharacterized protein n=1 Tax=Hyalomma asiaticum TaxID=266040 RepID=A0ACB7SQ96_HYAAI|nr:hypothetical protein HPB50_023211 [Hyalomma asiaticum]